MDATSLWNAYATGDDAARDALLAEHLGLVHFVARQVARKLSADADFDELLSAVYRLRELGEGIRPSAPATDVVIEIEQHKDGTLLVLPASAA